MACLEKVILYVDDDADDREFLSDAIKDANPEIRVDLAINGLVAIDYLQCSKENQALPCLIILDLNMPIVDGLEVFNNIRSDVRLRDVPLIIFSSSEKDADRKMFNDLGIEYITKPSNLSYLKTVASHFVQICAH